MPRIIRVGTLLAMVWLGSAAGHAQVAVPSHLPEIRYHLTARPWQPLNVPGDQYLDRIEGVVRYEATLQNAGGAIIDPVKNQEWQYATPYYANALGALLSAGRAQDLLNSGVAAMNSASSQMAQGNAAIPQQHGNFFVAPMADALSLYAPFVAASQITTWRNRMMRPIGEITKTDPHNWRTYAMKGEWYRARAGLVSTSTATSYIEDSYATTQRSRFTGNTWNLYHDHSTDPDTFAYDAIARGNLWAMTERTYTGASNAEIRGFVERGTWTSLLLQDPSGQAPSSGRSGAHVWNDVGYAWDFEMMAEKARADGNLRRAGQYRRAAMLAQRSIDRWRNPAGYFHVTKNRFDPALQVGYASYSALTNYNGNVIYHLSEAWRARRSAIAEEPAPTEIGGYAIVPDAEFALAVLNAGGMQIQATLRGSTALRFTRYWSALGLTRFGRVGWDNRLGPSEGIRDATSGAGVSYAPTFLEGTTWQRMASLPTRYEAVLTTSLVHPLLVRARLQYRPKAGQTGPTFNDDLVITPDGVLSTVTGTGSYGVTWPVLTNDGTTVNAGFTSHIASVRYPTGGDEQNFIALHPSPTLSTTIATVRSAYGDLRPVRMVSNAADAQTFVYPRGAGDPTAESVRTSFVRAGGDFRTVLGRVSGSLYVGRTSAGGVGTGIDLDGNGSQDVTFSTSCGFILQLSGGAVTAVEADRAVTANVRGQTIALEAYSPVTVTEGPPTPTPTPTPTATPTLPVTPTPTPTTGPSQPIPVPASAVTASTHDGNLPANTVDGSLATRWSANGDGQWIRYDLGSVRPVGHVRVAFYSGNVRRSFFDLQVSGDGAAWTTVVAGGQSSGTTTAEETFDFADLDTRYVRYLGHGNSINSWNSLAEVRLFTPDGATVPPPTPTPTPTAPPASTPTPTPTPTVPAPTYIEVTPLASAVTASTHDGNLPANTVDNDLLTRWSANGDGQWLQLDLGTTRTVGYLRVAVYRGNERASRFDLQVSECCGVWNTVFSGQSSGTTTAEQTYDFSDVPARYVRYLGHGNTSATSSTWNSVTEVSVFAVP